MGTTCIKPERRVRGERRGRGKSSLQQPAFPQGWGRWRGCVHAPFAGASPPAPPGLQPFPPSSPAWLVVDGGGSGDTRVPRQPSQLVALQHLRVVRSAPRASSSEGPCGASRHQHPERTLSPSWGAAAPPGVTCRSAGDRLLRIPCCREGTPLWGRGGPSLPCRGGRAARCP